MSSRKLQSVLAFVVVFVSFLLSTGMSLWTISSMAQKSAKDLDTMLAARVYDAISNRLGEPIIVAKTMAHDRFLLDLLEDEKNMSEQDATEKMRQYLWGIKDGMDYHTAFVVSESSHRYYTYEGLSKVVDLEHNERDVWYSMFAEQQKAYDLDVDVDSLHNDKWTVFVNAAIEDDGVWMGVCGVGVRMTDLQDLFFEFEEEYGVKISLVDSNGLVQVDTDEVNIEQAYLDPEIVGKWDSKEYVYQYNGNGKSTVTKYVENLGWYMVVTCNGSSVREAFRTVVLPNLLLCALVMGALVLTTHIVRRRSDALRAASMVDALTGLENRRAYEEEKDRLMTGRMPNDLVCVSVDVNGLKQANDNFGHEAGDELICGAAQCLKSCFTSYGSVYRTGGDEFSALLEIPGDEFDSVRETLDAHVSAWHGKKVDSLSISCGFVRRDEFPSENIAELYRIADERMYAAKIEHYRRQGVER